MKDYYYKPKEKTGKSERIARTIAIIMTIAFIIVLGWALWQNNQNQRLGNLLESEYQRSFYSLVNSSNELSLVTGKILASGGRQNNQMFRDMKAQAENIVASLNNLPLEENSITRTSQYFNQVADYAGSLLKYIGDGNSLPDEDYATIKKINGEVKELGEIIARLEEKTGTGSLLFNAGNSPLKGGVAAVFGKEGEEKNPKNAMTYFDEVNDKLSLLEAMNYDGAYSSHLREIEPKSLKAGEDIGAAEAKKIALEFAKIMTDKKPELSSSQDIGAKTKMPAYGFEFKIGENSLRITVSKSGGKVLDAYNSRKTDKAVLSNEEGIKKAEAFLNAAGYKSMELICQKKEDDRLILGFARLEKDILYYPDCLQVCVALDNGDILVFQAKEYWQNFNDKRELPADTMELNGVMNSLNKGMKVSGNRMALIADEAGKEILCYEFKGNIGRDEYLVYMNSQGGLEEKILSCFSSEDGFFTR